MFCGFLLAFTMFLRLHDGMMLREAKPDWSQVTQSVLTELEALLGARPVSGEIVWGSYSPSASFRIQLENGHQVFAKGSYPGQDSFGVIANRREADIYESVTKLAALAPHYHGHIETDGWFLTVLEVLTPAQPSLPWTETKLRAVFARLGDLHALYPDRASVPELVHDLKDDPFSGAIYRGEEGFSLLTSEADWQAVAGHFTAMPDAKDWLQQERRKMIELEQTLPQLPDTERLVHLDLRSDNIIFDKDRGAVILDWPCASWGAVGMDLTYFLLACEAEGAGPAESFWPLVQQETGYQFKSENWQAQLASAVGFFAARAIRPDIAELPRLRAWQQKSLRAAAAAYRRIG
jgi:hypothetical protein